MSAEQCAVQDGSCVGRRQAGERCREPRKQRLRIQRVAMAGCSEFLGLVLLVVLVGNGGAVGSGRNPWSKGWGMHAERGLLRPVGGGLAVEMPRSRARPLKQQSLSAHPPAPPAPAVSDDVGESASSEEIHSSETRDTGSLEPKIHQSVAQRPHISSLRVSPDRDESWIVPALTRVMEDDEAKKFHISERGVEARHAREALPARPHEEHKAPARGRTAASAQHHPIPKTTEEVHHKLIHSFKPMIQLPDAGTPAPDAGTPAPDAAPPVEDTEEEKVEEKDEKKGRMFPHDENKHTKEEEERDIEDGVREAFDFNKVKYADIPLHYWAWCMAVIFVVLTIVISGNLILKHLDNYEQPEVQKYVVRILFMAPLYGVDALLCLTLDGVSPTLNVIRDCYEAFTLYSFTKMLYVWLGGEREVIRMMSQKKQMQLPFPLHAMEPWAMGDEMFYNCKLGVIQYVFIIPFLAVATFICAAAGVYEGEQWYTVDLWISILACVSATYAIYCLITFYLSMQEELEASVSNALAKFLCVKAVVFFCFWQELVLQLVLMIGAMPETEQFSSRRLVGAIQEWLICFEMFVIAICFTLAYPVEEIIEMKTLNTKGDSYGTFNKDEDPNVV